MAEIWDKWLPGVLCKQQIRDLCASGFIANANLEDMDDPTIDLHLTDDAYELVRGAVKPFGAGFLKGVLEEGLGKKLTPNKNGEFNLQVRNTYLFRLREEVVGNASGVLWGQATAKSSVGRLDVLARLVVDGMRHYEGFSGNELGKSTSQMYLEVTPFTFPVVVRAGISLNQLRLFYGPPSHCEIKGKEVARTCFGGSGTDHNLTVDLSPIEVVPGALGSGFRVRPEASGPAIKLWKLPDDEKPDPALWWDLVQADRYKRFRIAKGQHFYILRSKEKLSLPPGVAVYARAIDEEIGEMRIHYAGFAHPWFGWDRKDNEPGTPLIFEVRGHDVDVNLRDGEILARLQFFRMSEDEEKGKEKSYGKQILNLSGYLGQWKSKPNVVPGEKA